MQPLREWWSRAWSWLGQRSPWPLRAGKLEGWLAGWLGDAGERQAAKFLKRLGYRIVTRRFRFGRGDIDLVALDGQTIVFVEVKTRRSSDWGTPEEAVDHFKQKQLTKLALAFLKRYNLLERAARFDVVSIVWPDDRQPPKITHFQNAFPAIGRGQMFS